MKKRPFLTLALILAPIIVTVFSGSVFALKGNEDDLMKIALARGLVKCYTAGDDYIKSSGVKKSDFQKINGGGVSILLGTNESGLFYIPTLVGNSYTESITSGTSCKEMFLGHDATSGDSNSHKGLINGYFKAPPLLIGYGYAPTGTGGAEIKKDMVVFNVTVEDASRQNTTGTTVTTEGANGLYCKAEKHSYESAGETKYNWKNMECSGKIKINYNDGEKDISFYLIGNDTYIYIREQLVYTKANSSIMRIHLRAYLTALRHRAQMLI